MDGLVEQAEAFLRIVFEGPLDLIVVVHSRRCVKVAVISMKGVVARAIYGVTLTCELCVRRILNRSSTELRPEGAAKQFSREQPLILDTSVWDQKKLIPDEEQLSIHVNSAIMSGGDREYRQSVWSPLPVLQH